MFCEGALCLEDSCADATSTCIANAFILFFCGISQSRFCKERKQ